MAPNLMPSTRFQIVITSVLTCPTTLPWQPTQHSACAALLECLGNTRTTDAMGTQYKIEFQYNTTAFTVTASSKGGCHPFDPHRINLPSIPVLVAFYHACLGFPVKDSWLNAIRAGNCDTFAGLAYSNVACYCRNSDETILGQLAQSQKNPVDQTTANTLHQSASSYQGPSTAAPPADALREVFLLVYPISKLYTDDTGWFPV
jgi:hypothetical protein